MRIARHLLLTMLLAASAIVMACTDAGSPTAPAHSSMSFSAAQQEMTKEEWQERHEELKLLLKREKDRIKAEKELRKGEYELARQEWKAYKHQWKRAKKAKLMFEVELLRCKPRAWDKEIEIIGPDGGTVQVGEHKLVIPRGALEQEYLISAEAPTSSLIDVEFQPEGLRFARSAELTLSYKDCFVPNDVDLRLAYLGWGQRVLELPPSEDRKELSEVIGDIDHFSRYAVAY
jgi:hypothetical protein